MGWSKGLKALVELECWHLIFFNYSCCLLKFENNSKKIPVVQPPGLIKRFNVLL